MNQSLIAVNGNPGRDGKGVGAEIMLEIYLMTKE